MLVAIERATRQEIERLELPSTEAVNNQRIAKFKQRISDTLATGELAFMQSLVEQYRDEHDVPAVEIAAALAKLSLGDKPMLLEKEAPRLDPEGFVSPVLDQRIYIWPPKPAFLAVLLISVGLLVAVPRLKRSHQR